MVKKAPGATVADWNRERSASAPGDPSAGASGRDIGRLPPVKNPKRKQAAARSLRLFCLTYLAAAFSKPFSDDHLKIIAELEKAILTGGLFALAMPRGSGKTTLAEAAALWAVLYGYHPYVLIVGATAKLAVDILNSIKSELRSNDLLAEDFPEVCFPIRALEGINNRAAGQRFNGQPTLMNWRKASIVLPTIAGSPASGAILNACGLFGAVRGQKFKHPDGRNVRPSLILPDDPQTDRSARSPKQCNDREEMLKGALLGSAGPGESLTVVMPCTVIVPGDLADRMLDRELNPDWSGIRTKTLYAFPDALDTLWAEYRELNATDKAAGTAFYRKHQKAMDAGAKVAWVHRFRKDEASAIQHAMNLFYRDPYAFAAEHQNDPRVKNAGPVIRILTAKEIAAKINRVPRGQLAADVSILNAKIDVQQDVLFWAVAGWSQTFGGHVADYGTWPDQARPYFTLHELAQTIRDAFPNLTAQEALIYAALEVTAEMLLTREFARQGGAVLRVGKLVIDAGYQTDCVYKFCRESKFAALCLPSHGHSVKAKDRPISQWKKQEGDRRGLEWIIRRAANQRGVRHVTYDTNFWKSFLHARYAAGHGDRSSLALFGDTPAAHRMFADHQVAEYPTRVEAKGRKIDEWEIKPERPDNHWFDCLVGCAVAASVDGCELRHTDTPPTPPPPPRRRKRVDYLN